MTKKTSLVIGLIIFVLALGVGYFGSKPRTPRQLPTYQNGQMQNSTSTGNSGSTGTKTGSGSTGTGSTGSNQPKVYTIADVQKHNDANSCWTAINGGVYDLTNWINAHPGGPEAILAICGTDGSAMFNAQHGGQRRPESELAGFQIGVLAQAL